MELSHKMRWLMSFRIAFLLVMGVSGFMLYAFYEDPINSTLLHLLGAGFLFTGIAAVFYYFLPQNTLRVQAWIHILWDLLFTTVIVYRTGGFSAITLLYIVQIMSAGMILSSAGAIFASIVSVLGLGNIVAWNYGVGLLGDPASISIFLFSASIFLLVGGAVASFFRARERLARSYERLAELHSAIIDHIPSGILYVDEEGIVRLENQAARKILERSVLHLTLHRTELRFLCEDGVRRESYYRIDQSEKTIGHHASRLPNHGVLVVFQDLTQIRDLVAKVQLHEKLVSIGQLAAGIAHEIRNPLASLSGSIQLLRGEMPDDSESGRLMKIVLRETDRLDTLIQNLLNYAKPSALQIAKVRIAELCEEILELVRNSADFSTRKIKVSSHIDSQLFCHCDAGQLKQILWNLLKNSIQSIDVEGQIDLRVSPRVQGGMDWVHFEIEDTGSGMSEEIKAKIFDPFFSTKSSGTGLGLALVFQMVKSHGGMVGVETKERKGTTFWFDLLRDGPRLEMDGVGVSAA